MGKLINRAGERYGTLTVLDEYERRNGKTFWHVKCDCGRDYWTPAGYLPKQKTCGSAAHRSRLTDEERKERRRKQRAEHKKEWSEQRKANREYYIRIGVCSVCHKRPPVEGILMCEECRERHNEILDKSRATRTEEKKESDREKRKIRHIERHSALVKNGICTRCGKNPAKEGHRQCSSCLSKQRMRVHRKRKSDPSYIERSEWNSCGLCYTCKKPIRIGEKQCDECRKITLYNLKLGRLRQHNGDHIWRKYNHNLMRKNNGRNADGNGGV